MPAAASVTSGEGGAYHDATKHSWTSIRERHHSLDWETKPFPFKVYPDAPVIALPRDVAPLGLPILEALGRVGEAGGGAPVDLATLAQVLFLSAGVTKKKTYAGDDPLHFRAAASTGALYEVEVYVVAGPIEGLDAGVYHFCPGDFALRRLRAGDHRATLAATASEPDRVGTAPLTLVLSAIYWRNTWKYQARAYRHFFWDAGTLLANVLVTATALDLPARVLLGFTDGAVNLLLGLGDTREGALALVPLGAALAPAPPAPPSEALSLATVPLSPREVDYPLVRAAYLASALPDGAAARAWAGRPWPGGPGTASPPRGAAPPDRTPPSTPLSETILRRGSTRRFARAAIGKDELTAILETAGGPLPLDASDPAVPLVDLYLLVHAVDGLPAGAYTRDPRTRALRLLRAGDFRAEGAYLCLEQPLGGDASAVVFFLADLGSVLAHQGSRGYRAVNLAAGLLGGRIYLAAYGLGLGATGLTFYDDDVTRFFSPDARGKDAIFVTALGRPERAARPTAPPLLDGRLERVRPGEA